MSDQEASVSSHENDLPLMSNIDDILVYHYVLALKCHLENKILSGSIILYCKPPENYDGQNVASDTVHGDLPSTYTENPGDLSRNSSPKTGVESNTDIGPCMSCDDNSSTPNMNSSPKAAVESNTDTGPDPCMSCNKEPCDLGRNSSPNTGVVSTKDTGPCMSCGDTSSRLNRTSSAKAATVSNTDTGPFMSSEETTVLGADGTSVLSTLETGTLDDPSDLGVLDNNPCRQTSDRKRKFDSSDESEDTISPNFVQQVKSKEDDNMATEHGLPVHVRPIQCSGLPRNEHDIKVHGDSGHKVKGEFQIVLDCCDLDIRSIQDMTDVSEILDDILVDADPVNKIKIVNEMADTYNEHRLQFTVEKYCVRVYKPGCYPKMVKISFETKPEGQSLKWTQDQDNRPCVYTHGNWINNRSLFPSQDISTSMATWQAVVSVEKDVTVVMTGDKNPVINTSAEGWTSFYFHTKMPMPSSTISLAIGHWQMVTLIDNDCHPHQIEDKTIPCRLFCPASLMSPAQSEIGPYTRSCLVAAYDTLGPHPFQRLDIVVVPSAFDSLGMASPSLLFVSQSVLVGDYSMCVHLAHEICHSWFGLAIGPKDWTEEWLTEGFCTYTEDIVHNRAMQTVGGWTEEYGDHHREIRDYLRYRTLVAELNHTEEDLQTLRPSKAEPSGLTHTQGESSVAYVKNGMNPDKRFMQVHYLKGYFLLRYLEMLTGRDSLLSLMQKYVRHFHGKLVTSQDVLTYFLTNSPELQSKAITVAEINEQWLDCPGIPQHLQGFQLGVDNRTAKVVLEEVQELNDLSRHWKRKTRKWKQKRESLLQMDAIQLSLFLEELIQADKVAKDILHAIRTFYNIELHNAEVQHRWCELVIKNKARKHYDDVRRFLLNHQAMGVYLYGELIITRDREQKELALEVFELLKQEMEPDLLKAVQAMLFGE